MRDPSQSCSRGQGRAALWFLALAVGCADPRPLVGDLRGCPTWQPGDLSNGTAPRIDLLFSDNCVSCHSGPSPAGNTDLSSYLGVLGLGLPLDPNASPVPVAVAGDTTSRLIEALTPTKADAIHAQFSALAPTVAEWVGTCGLPLFNSAVHAGGILNPADPGFHGKLLQASHWDYGVCAQCHGADFTGGTSHVSCTSCHAGQGGPTSCSTCHGLPPAEGAHFTHVDAGALDKPLGCGECHLVPKAYTDPGMLFDADGGVLTGPPSVIFGPLASTPGFNRQGPPTFDPSTQTCSSVYCHGDTLGDHNATNTRPHWSQPGTGQAACGTCHGLPPSDHGSGLTQCSDCHGLVVAPDRTFVNAALHIDGALTLGNGDGTCSACHGDASSPAPPRDLAGHTTTAAIGVGAHRSHLQALDGLRGPIACGDCHLVPATAGSPGHIDHDLPATVFPATISATSLAFANGATPVEDHATASCATVYCHGGGTQMQTDRSLGLRRTPIWTAVNAGQAACGSCHGVPPQDGVIGHSLGAGLSTCAACHPGTVDADGNILLTPLADGGVTSQHIDGVIEVDGGVWSGP